MAFVVDFGSQNVRVGYVDEDGEHVNSSFPSALGSSRDGGVKFLGETLLKEVKRQESLNISYPVQFGFITNWDTYEEVRMSVGKVYSVTFSLTYVVLDVPPNTLIWL